MYASLAIHVRHTRPNNFDGDDSEINVQINGTTGGATSDFAYGLEIQKDLAMDCVSLLPLITGNKTDDSPVHPFITYQTGFAYDGAIREGDWVLLVDRKTMRQSCTTSNLTWYSKPILLAGLSPGI